MSSLFSLFIELTILTKVLMLATFYLKDFPLQILFSLFLFISLLAVIMIVSSKAIYAGFLPTHCRQHKTLIFLSLYMMKIEREIDFGFQKRL